MLIHHRICAANDWFELHQGALNRIDKLRNREICDANRVKIAILDSGVELSPDDAEIYNRDPEMNFKNWTDQSAEWTDDEGHGTHLATLLRRTAPNAIIHVAKVYKKSPTEDKSADRVAEVRACLVLNA
jgi:hypothetical protein